MFDEDPNDQANISGADLAQLVDELKAAKQRELELQAVIDIAKSALVRLSIGSCTCNTIHPDYQFHGVDCRYRIAARAFDACANPSQALREHEAKVVAEYKQRAEAAEAKLRELEMQEPVFILMQAGADRDDLNADERSIILDRTDSAISDYIDDGYTKTNLYAKPFPAPKQEEK